jgi:hypothetical protein
VDIGIGIILAREASVPRHGDGRCSTRRSQSLSFAVANGETLRYIPCYGGCGNPCVGHKSNADCYVAERFPDGRITFTSHAAG